MRSEQVRMILENIASVGHEKFMVAYLDTLSVKQLGVLSAFVDTLCPNRVNMRYASDALVNMGVLPNEAQMIVEEAARRVSVEDMGQFLFVCFRIRDERRQKREEVIYEPKPE